MLRRRNGFSARHCRSLIRYPRTITVDKNAAYPKATMEMKKDGELRRRSWLRQVKS